jgi:C4-dicarboxylate transporter DctQ subunit
MWRWLERLEEGLIAFLLALMTVITFVQVIARYVFNYSFVWALELVFFLFVWLIFIGMSYGVRTGSHIGMYAVVKMPGLRFGRLLTFPAIVLCIVYSAILFYGSWHYVSAIYRIGNYAQDLPVPVWVPHLALPIGFALLTIRFSEALYRVVIRRDMQLIGDETEEALKSSIDEKPPSREERP